MKRKQIVKTKLIKQIIIFAIENQGLHTCRDLSSYLDLGETYVNRLLRELYEDGHLQRTRKKYNELYKYTIVS